MKLSQLQPGDDAVVTSVASNGTLKDRLASFGLVRGSELSVEAYSIAKQTVEIKANDTLIGLRSREADQIEVEKC